MAIPQWQPGTLYQPGDIVIPITMPSPTSASITNGDFSGGATGWDFTGGAAYASSGGYNGGGCVQMPGSVTDGLALNKSQLVVPVGKTFDAACVINQGASIAGATRGWVEVRWYTGEDVLVSSQMGNIIAQGNSYKQSKVTATCPKGAAYARVGIGLWSVGDHSHPVFGDNLTVTGSFAGLPEGLAYKAMQSESGYSAGTEPAWPPILGQTVVDNDVTWEAIAISRVTWEAEALYVSGGSEPTWPTEIGGMVLDGTVNWVAVSRRVEDENCPNTKIVAIAASKVFCGDDDIVRYSATVNPLDWTTANDAGYLPTGLQNYGANPVAAMGLYRSNVVPFNAEAFQNWQVDEDPASMALLDALPIGSTYQHALSPVSNDLFFLSSQGVRSIGIAASSTNLQAGDVGMPIDPLVRAAMAEDDEPMSLYYPAAGQYWLMFDRMENLAGEDSEPIYQAITEAFVYTMTGSGKTGAWSRYVFPFAVDDWCIAGDVLYLRSGDYIHRMDDDVIGDETSPGVVQDFPGVIQWPWLDFGSAGVTKMMHGFDIVGEGNVSVTFGIDQRNPALFTPEYLVPADTVPGMVIAMPLAAPSLSVKLSYDGSEKWQWNALQLYFQDQRGMA